MPTVIQGPALFIALNSGYTLTITTDAASSGNVRHVSFDGSNRTGNQLQSVPVSSTRVFGPFNKTHHYSLEVDAGSFTYAITLEDMAPSTLVGNVEGFTGARTLRDEDNGKLLRCDDSSAVTVTVPNNLRQGFNIGFAMWGAGTVTISAASGATNRSSTSALNVQYQAGSLIVMKNGSGTAAEFSLGGDFA